MIRGEPTVAAPILEWGHRDIVLSNGLSVVLIPQPSVHRAVASLYLRVGSRYETKDTNGLSHFLEHMLFRGTPRHPTAHAQALAFERLGGTLYAATHVDHGEMSVTVPPKNLHAILELLGEVASEPILGDIEVERGIVREEILEDLDDDGRDIDADNLVRALMYDDHPLGFTITGHIDQLDRFDAPLLKAHHARHYTAQNAVLAVAGNLGDVDACALAAERAFGSLRRGERVQPAPPRLDQKKPRVRFVENQSSQTELRVAFRAPSERDPMEPATEMLLRILDDGMSTRLYERICDRLGLCYDVSGAFETYEDDGVVDVAAGARHSRTPQVAREIFTLLREVCDHGPTEDELTKARDRHLWSVEAMLDDPEETAAFHGLSALAGTLRSPVLRHEQLTAVTRDQVREAAQRIFRPDRLSVTAVGLLKDSDVTKLERSIKSLS
ncbi:MAG: pitrilysin family protein [Polyangiaceae bacterium]